MEIFTAALDIFEILFDEVWEFYKVQLEFSTQSSRSSEPAEWNYNCNEIAFLFLCSLKFKKYVWKTLLDKLQLTYLLTSSNLWSSPYQKDHQKMFSYICNPFFLNLRLS